MSENHSIEYAQQSILELAKQMLCAATGAEQAEAFEVVINARTTRLRISSSPGEPHVQQRQNSNSLEEAILDAIDGRMLSEKEIARFVGVPVTILIWKGDVLARMAQKGLIAYDTDSGRYYRANPALCRPYLMPLEEEKPRGVPAAQRNRPLERRKARYVYCIGCGKRRRIKIGIAVDPSKRLGELQCASANHLELLGVCEGDGCLEKRLHRRFAEFRVRGEWFRDCPEIRAFIAEEMKPWPLPSV